MSESIGSINEESLRVDIKELLEQEADELVNAERYERTADREAYRSGHNKRKLVTSAGEVVLDVPKLRGATFQTAVIERYRRRETSVEEAIIEMYLAGVSTRRIEDVSQILWGAGVSAGTVSNLNDKAFASVEERGNRPLEGEYPYVFVDGVYLKRSWGGSYENVSVMVAKASTGTATARSSAARRGSPSRRTRGRSSCCGCAGAASRACAWSPATSRSGCSAPSRRCSRRPSTSDAPCISTETSSARSPGRSVRGSPRCSRPSTRRNPSRLPWPRPRAWRQTSRR